MSLTEKLGFVIGVWLGVVLYGPARLLYREVVAYNAVNAEHGPVRVVVTSNRVTGRRRRIVWTRDPND